MLILRNIVFAYDPDSEPNSKNTLKWCVLFNQQGLNPTMFLLELRSKFANLSEWDWDIFCILSL